MKHLPKQIDENANRAFFYENHWKRVGLDLLAAHCGTLEGMSLLDYGCGRGETLALAHGLGMEVLGTDPDPECVEITGQHGESVLLKNPDNPAEQFGEKSHDVVTCFHVLEHVARPLDVLSSLGRIARTHLVVAVPNLRSLPRLKHLRNEPRFVNEGHLQGWDHAHFRNLVERHCGMHLVEWGHDHVKVPLISEMIRRIAGEKAIMRLETVAFLKWLPYHSASIIALIEVEPK